MSLRSTTTGEMVAPGVGSVRTTSRFAGGEDFPFKGGTYNFIVRTDDGIRVWVDKDLVIDAWHGQSVTTYQQEVALQKGKHIVRVEYYEATGIAIVQVHWARLPPAAISRDGSTDAAPPVMRQPSPRDYADHILTYEPLITPPVPNFANPLRALGPPDNERVSLGGNGSILEVEFTDNILYNGEAADLRVVELGSAEVCDVYVWTNGSFVFLGNGQGSADFDLGRVGIDGPVTIVRIVDRSPAGIGEPSSGSDIDAVIALNSGPLP